MRSIIFCCFVILISQSSSSKSITLGQATTTSAAYSGINTQYGYSSVELILTKSELNDSGNISSLSLYKTSGDTATTIDSVSVYLKESDSALSNTVNLTGYTQVYSGSLPNNIKDGWVQLIFPSLYLYTGSKNLSILIVRKSGSKLVSNLPSYSVNYSSAKTHQAAYYSGDTNPWKSGKSYQNLNNQYRPVIRLEID
jgi:hypothetical protein